MSMEGLHSLELQKFPYHGLFLKYNHAKIKSFSLSSGGAIGEKWNNVDWPLESLSIFTVLHEVSWNSILKKEFCKNLQQLSVILFQDLTDIYKFENLIELNITNFVEATDNMIPLSKLAKLKRLRYTQIVNWNDDLLDFFSSLVQLEVLKLREMSHSKEFISGRGLSNFGRLINLTELDISNCNIQNVEHLSSIISLRILNLSDNLITDESLEYFYKLVNLTALYVNNNQIKNNGVNYLSGLCCLGTLHISNNLFNEEGLKNIFYLRNLTNLNLGNNHLEGNLLPELCMQLPHMEDLDLSNNKLSASSCRNIHKMKNIIHLNISDNPKIGDMTLCSLYELNISKLEANNCGITDAGIASYLKNYSSYHSNFSKLEISIQENYFTNNSIEEFTNYSKFIRRLTISDSPKFAPYSIKKLVPRPEKKGCVCF